MSVPIDPYKRKQPWCHRGKGPNGQELCHCGCGREVNPPRRTAYSDECVTTYKRHSDPATIRRIVEERDHGICALCGVDTILRAKVVQQTGPLVKWLARRHAETLYAAGELEPFPGFTESAIRYHAVRVSENGGKAAWHDCYLWSEHWAAEEMRRRFGDIGTTHHWEADHIVPVIEGGGGCGPEGYRTLCITCHHTETAKLAARRAKRRRSEIKPQPELQLLSVA